MLNNVVNVGSKPLIIIVNSLNDLLSSVLDHLNHLLLIDTIAVRILVVKLTLLHNHVIDLQLSGGLFDDLLLDRVLCDKAVDDDFPLLANPMGSIDSLKIHLRIPI